MILYHGSNVEVKEPILLKVQRELDFGKGFYTTSDLEQAARWAWRTAKRRGESNAFVTVYEVNEDELKNIRLLSFDSPNVEWLNFVVKNRKGEYIAGNWDIISGPVADDQTAQVIDLYLEGAYDEEEAIRRFLTQRLKDQYAFKTNEALKLLIFKEVITL
jgi:hypothetical protein